MEKVRQILAQASHGMLATCVGGQPRVRPMAFVLREDGCLWSSTYDVSGKMREWAENPLVEVCFVDGQANQVRIEGVVDTSGGEESKRELLRLNPRVGKHFQDEQDPKFVHVTVRPTRIRWKPPGFSEYREVTGWRTP